MYSLKKKCLEVNLHAFVVFSIVCFNITHYGVNCLAYEVKHRVIRVSAPVRSLMSEVQYC